MGSCLVKCITFLRQAERSYLFVFSFLLWCTLNSVDLSEASLNYKYRDVQCTADALKLESMVRLRLESFIESKLKVIVHYSVLSFFSTYYKLRQSCKCISL